MLLLQGVPPNPAAADTARTILNLNIPQRGLPLVLVAVLLLGYFAAIIYAISKAKEFKSYAQDFPSQTAPVVVALVLLLLSAPIYLTLIALRMDLSEGAGFWLVSLLTMAGVSGVGGLAVKRYTSPEYLQNKAIVEGAKAAAAPSQVNVQGGANISATSEQPIPVPLPVVPAKPAVPVAVPRPAEKPKDDALLAAANADAHPDIPGEGG